MSTVDNKIVQMTFDNATFEKKLADTMQSLDKLKAGLDFAGSKRSLSDLSTATNNFSMQGMGSAIDGISTKFLAMSAIGITVLSNLTNRVVDAGIRLGKSLSLDQVIGGFREYETNMNSIQTILANTESKGENLNTVNAALDELNTYADQTIYNFSEMTRNIGTFTAAGVALDTSTQAIKGIANLAAISGSNSQQASTAMYQLSQALASGSVKLMDWNSVVNAGMGGEVFQKALFETGKTLGTIADVPMDQTFDEWKDAGNTFRASLEQGWITSEVLTNTLQGFTGDLTEAQIMAMGYTEEQTKAIMKMGQTGKDAATKVKTFTQLISTLQEAVGSGWATSFRLIIGDFEQAKALFTGISDTLGEMIGNSADSRNDLLKRWAIQGGRTDVLDGLKSGFEALMGVIKPISEAFRTIFPPMTAYRLAELSKQFKEFMDRLVPGEITMLRIKNTFIGLFSVIEIGWTIIKETAGLFKELFDALTSNVDTGGVGEFLFRLGDTLKDLNQKLVAGGGIADFFDQISEAIVNFINDPMAALNDLKDIFEEVFNILFKGDFTGISKLTEDSGIVDFLFDVREAMVRFAEDPLAPLRELKDIAEEVFNILFKGDFEGISKLAEDSAIVDFLFDVRDAIGSLFDDAPQLESGFDRLEQRFSGLREVARNFTDVPDWLSQGLEDTRRIISEWFGELGEKLAAAMGPGDFDAVMDALNISLLGGIALLLKKFLDGGLKLDLGGGIVENINETLGALTGKLTAMQTEIKANALLKIAGAIALLTASVLVLSMIDSAALTKALTAMTVGFGQLIGAMTLITKLNMGPRSAATMVAIATGMVILAGAVLILSLAVKTLSSLSWEELLKGLLGVSVLLNLIAQSAQAMQGNTAGLVRAGIGIIFIATAMNILAVAMKIFATMSWEEMGKGLLGVAGGLGTIVLAVNKMPDNMVAKGAGILLIGAGLNLIATSMKIFATMSWEQIGKGLLGVAGGLAAIVIAMNHMPEKQLLASATAMLIVSVSLNAIATAMKIMASMSWDELARGLTGMAGSLAILAAASYLMSGSLAGALAIGVMAFSLGTLYQVVKEFSKLSLNELGMGLLGMAAALAVLGAMAFILSPLVLSMLGLGAAMLMIGAGFALIGLGANAVARAFGVIAKAGKAGIETVLFFIDALLERVPDIIGAFAMGLVELAQTFLDAAPVLIKSLGVLIQHVLETIRDLTPEFVATGIVMISEFLRGLREVIPEVIETGLAILIAFLSGVRDNIGEITTLVSDIMINFMNAFEEKIPELVSSFVSLLITFFESVAEGVGLVAGTLLLGVGESFLGGFWTGISGKVGEIYGNISGFISDVIDWFKSGFGIFSPSKVMAVLGGDLMLGLLKGIVDGAVAVTNWFKDLAKNTLKWIGTVTRTLAEKGIDLIAGLWNGIWERIQTVMTWYRNLGFMVLGWIGEVGTTLYRKGRDLIKGLWEGIWERIQSIITWFKNIGNTIIGWFGAGIGTLLQLGKDIVQGLWNGIQERWAEMVGWVQGKVDALVDLIKAPWNAFSPSRTMMELGDNIVEGLAVGIRKNMHAENEIENVATNMQKALEKVVEQVTATANGIGDSIEMRITPVLDLTGVQRDAKQLGMLGGLSPKITADLSYGHANTIASTDISQNGSSIEQNAAPREVKFEQNNYSPSQLSVADIYRQTRNQITVAKEELGIR